MLGAVILTTAVLVIALIFAYDIWADDLKRWWTACRGAKQVKREQKRQKAFIADCMREHQEWEERKLERDQRQAERERRRQREERQREAA